MKIILRLGDSRDLMKRLPTSSIDAVVMDPPYGLRFMGKAWDYDIPDQSIFNELFRVLKPGGHLLSFWGTRTFHRGTCRIEDAGLEIRDLIAWVYGKGMPKGQKVGDGWSTTLKPALEPITVARKPLDGTIKENFDRWGTGAFNVNGCRIPADGEKLTKHISKTDNKVFGQIHGFHEARQSPGQELGRWPANLVHDGGDYFPGMTSRFFYSAKAEKEKAADGNNHPTVKPLALMQWLVRLVCHKGGTVLDPFMGSGSTGVACRREGLGFIGFEISSEYFAIAKRRIGGLDEVVD